MSKLFSTTTISTDVCTHCGSPAVTRSAHTGNYSCMPTANQCPEVRKKNSAGVRKAHESGKLNTDHLTFEIRGSGWRGKNGLINPEVLKHKYPTGIFSENSTAKRNYVKQLIIANNLIPLKCAECDIVDKWNGKSIVLQLDHINGHSNDQRLENLRFLCPNCHSQTHTFCGRNVQKAKTEDSVLVAALRSHPTIHKALVSLNLSSGKAHYARALKLIEQHNIENLK